MLFCYPIAATTENWLHECLYEMLTTIHTSIDEGQTPPIWPNSIPTEHRSKLWRHWGLRDRLDAYYKVASTLSVPQRQQVAISLISQNRIADLCRGGVDCERLDQLPKVIRGPVSDLFVFSFSLLASLGIRDRHYKLIYDTMQYHVCPFCGCEYFDAPEAPREDFDHYLSKSIYPFAAANLRNLVPMGIKCNERYKQTKDVLRNKESQRRRVFDPYANQNSKICLHNSVPFGGNDGQTPEWKIEFDPDLPECKTWDDVFRIRERIKRDVLDPSFRRWIWDFAKWFRIRMNNPAPDVATVSGAVKKYAEDMELMGLNAREFLRAPLFQMLHVHCANGDERLNKFMLDLVSMQGEN